MDRRALAPIVFGLLCFAVGLAVRAPLARGALMVVAACLIAYGAAVLSRSRR